MLSFVLVLALAWGVMFALILHYVPIGRFMVRRYTWLTLVIGIGVDMFLISLMLPLAEWLVVVGIITASSMGMIGRSLAVDSDEMKTLLESLDTPDAPQTDRRQ